MVKCCEFFGVFFGGGDIVVVVLFEELCVVELRFCIYSRVNKWSGILYVGVECFRPVGVRLFRVREFFFGIGGTGVSR